MKLRILLSLSVAAGIVASASAGIINIPSMTPGKSASLKVSYFGNTSNVLAGAQNAQYDGGAFFDAYCVEFQYTNNIPVSYAATPSSPLLLTNGARVAKLYNKYSGLVTSQKKGAALQAVIWDVLYDGGDGLSSGNFKVLGGTNTEFTNFAALAFGDSLIGVSSDATYYAADTHGKNNNLYQGLIGPATPAPVPEPATMAVLGLGVLGFLRRRRAR